MEDKPIILLDEPFSALDAGTRAEMQELAFEVLQHKTVILVTHDTGEALRLAHHLYVMKDRGFLACAIPNSPPLRLLKDSACIEAQLKLLSALNA